LTEIQLVEPDSVEQWAVARRLVEEYYASLHVDLGFQGIENEIDHLAQEYCSPSGCFLLAEADGQWLGCIALRRFDEGVCEMKRLYVMPEGRGRGLGRVLTEAIIARARGLGYKRMVLDTLPFMKDAQALYRSLGFEPTSPYRYNPIPGSAFLALKLE